MPAAASIVAKARGENFPVASRLLPARVRADLLALYGFARLADDIGDEAPGDRERLLDWLEGELDDLYAGTPRHELLRRLAPTVAAHAIPREPFERLIEAGRQDQHVTSYASFDDLLDYCRLSANPVGELVLHVFDRATADRVALSDRVCSGLQIVEHLQDVGEDRARGRVYLPAEDLERFGCTIAELDAPSASPALRRVIAHEAALARELLSAAAPLARTLPLRPALAVAAFASGGGAALTAIERRSFDVLPRTARATPGARLRALFLFLLRGRA